MRAGATHPARLPIEFCTPVHRPAASGPANVCVIAQPFEMPMPRNTPVNASIPTISGGVETWHGEASKELPHVAPVRHAALGSMGTSS